MRKCFTRSFLLWSALLAGVPLLAQVNPDPCKQVREDDVATLVSLNQSTVTTSPGPYENSCSFEVKTPLSFMGSEVRVKVKQFDTHAEAVEGMRFEAPLLFNKTPSLVKTAAGTDDYVRDTITPGMNYAEAEAVHDVYQTTVEVHGMEPGALAHPTFEYRLQRLALQAAGATILPTVGLAPDPVRPRPEPDTAEDTAHRGAASFFSRPVAIVLFSIVSLVLAVVVLRAIRKNG